MLPQPNLLLNSKYWLKLNQPLGLSRYIQSMLKICDWVCCEEEHMSIKKLLPHLKPNNIGMTVTQAVSGWG